MKKIIFPLLFLLIFVTIVSAENTVQMFEYGEKAFICVNCPQPKGDVVPYFECKANAKNPCLFYTGFKYLGTLDNLKSINIKTELPRYYVATPKQYSSNIKGDFPYLVDYQSKPLSKGTVLKGYVVNSMTNKIYSIDPKRSILGIVDAKVYIDNTAKSKSKLIAAQKKVILELQEDKKLIQSRIKSNRALLDLDGASRLEKGDTAINNIRRHNDKVLRLIRSDQSELDDLDREIAKKTKVLKGWGTDTSKAKAAQGQIFMIEGTSNTNSIPIQYVNTLGIPLKWGESIAFKGLDKEGKYDLNKPVIFVTTNALSAEAMKDLEKDAGYLNWDVLKTGVSMKDWWEGKGAYKGIDDYKDSNIQYQDREGKRSSKTICGQTFLNYAPGSAFELESSGNDCKVNKYKLTTMLFDSSDAINDKEFKYKCGGMDYFAQGGEEEFDTRYSYIRKLYCDQVDPKKAKLYCKKGDDWCTTAASFKIKIKDKGGEYTINFDTGTFIPKIQGSVRGNFEEASLGSLIVKGKQFWINGDHILLPKHTYANGKNVVTFNTKKSFIDLKVPSGTKITRVFNSGQMIIHNLQGSDYILDLGVEGGNKKHPIRALFPDKYPITQDKDYTNALYQKTKEFIKDRTEIASFGTKEESAFINLGSDKGDYEVTFKPVYPLRPLTNVEKATKEEAEQKMKCRNISVTQGSDSRQVIAYACYGVDYNKLTKGPKGVVHEIVNRIHGYPQAAPFFAKVNFKEGYAIQNLVKKKKAYYTILKTGDLCYQQIPEYDRKGIYTRVYPMLHPSCTFYPGQGMEMFKEALKKGEISPIKDVKPELKKVGACPLGTKAYTARNGDSMERIAYKLGILTKLPPIKTDPGWVEYRSFLNYVEKYNKKLFKMYSFWETTVGRAKTRTEGLKQQLAFEDKFGGRTYYLFPGEKICLPGALFKNETTKLRSKKSIAAKKVVKLAQKKKRLVPSSVKSLYVNRGSTKYSIKKSRTAGESDLLKLTQTESVEEAWIFAKYKNGVEEWFEIGEKYDESSGTIEKVDISFKRAPLNQVDKLSEVSFYHFHPKDTGNTHVLSQTPSAFDLDGTIRLFKSFRRVSFSLAAMFDNRIVVPTGVYKVKVSTIFTSVEERTALNKIEDMNLERRSLKNTGKTSNFDYTSANRGNFAKENKKFAKKYSSADMTISFSPKRF